MNFSEVQKELIFEIAQQLTGCSKTFRAETCLYNVAALMRDAGFPSVVDYLSFALDDPTEKSRLISALTIHTTHWFRDAKQLASFQTEVTHALASGYFERKKLRILSAGCSTGQELYSVALILERLIRRRRLESYEIVGLDIDPVSLEVAKHGNYVGIDATEHFLPEDGEVLLVSNQEESLTLEVSKTLREKVSFVAADLTQLIASLNSSFDIVLCRNVLIYFDELRTAAIVRNLIRYLSHTGLLVIGSSEGSPVEFLEEPKPIMTKVDSGVYRVQKQRNSALSKQNSNQPKRSQQILVVDDDPEIAQITKMFCEEAGFEALVHTDPVTALAEFRRSVYGVVLTDFFMPGMNGEQFMENARKIDPSVPFILVSGHGGRDFIVEQKRKGFVEVFPKPLELATLQAALQRLLGAPPVAGVSPTTDAPQTVEGFIEQMKGLPRPEVVLVGASTGGPQALAAALAGLPPNCPPIAIVQHISAEFSENFCKQLSQVTGLTAGEIGQPLKPGHYYVSLQERHLQLVRKAGGLTAVYGNNIKVHGQCPAVDVLFESAAKIFELKTLAALFTGMGRDGGKGLLALRKQGSVTFSQSEDSCAVYGMPRYARELGASQVVGSPADFRKLLLGVVEILK